MSLLAYAIVANVTATIGLFGWLVRALARGDFVPRAAVTSMSDAWKSADATRETARKEEREQLGRLIEELTDAVRANRKAA
jgi:hypothetical protein